LFFQTLWTKAAVTVEVIGFDDPPAVPARFPASPAAHVSRFRIFFQTAPAIGGIADIAYPGAVIAIVLFAAVAEVGFVEYSAAIGASVAVPVFQAHIWGMGVVGVENAVQGQEGIHQSPLYKGGGDWDGRIPSTDFAIADIGMGYFLIAGGRMGIQRGHFKY
jgi:hypothetical protein